MITKVQSADLERLGKEEGSSDYAWIFLGRGNKIDFKDGLGAGGWELERSGGEGDGMEGENVGIVAGIGEPLGSCGNFL